MIRIFHFCASDADDQSDENEEDEGTEDQDDDQSDRNEEDEEPASRRRPSDENEEDEANRKPHLQVHPHKISEDSGYGLGQHLKQDALAIHLNQRSPKLREMVTQ